MEPVMTPSFPATSELDAMRDMAAIEEAARSPKKHSVMRIIAFELGLLAIGILMLSSYVLGAMPVTGTCGGG
jgi:hypothetical protein